MKNILQALVCLLPIPFLFDVSSVSGAQDWPVLFRQWHPASEERPREVWEQLRAFTLRNRSLLLDNEVPLPEVIPVAMDLYFPVDGLGGVNFFHSDFRSPFAKMGDWYLLYSESGHVGVLSQAVFIHRIMQDGLPTVGMRVVLSFDERRHVAGWYAVRGAYKAEIGGLQFSVERLLAAEGVFDEETVGEGKSIGVMEPEFVGMVIPLSLYKREMGIQKAGRRGG